MNAHDIRHITIDDAPALLDLCLTLDGESSYMMYEPEERPTDIADIAGRISATVAAPNSAILVADAGSVLAGYVELSGGEFNRVRHVAYIVLGVRAAYAGQGIGSALLQRGEEWARSAGIARLELTVMTHNVAAIRLYRRQGFEIEGLRRRAMRVDGSWVDEHYMGKLLDP